MVRKTRYFIFAALTIFVYSCISEFTAKLPDNLDNILVVEGDIISDSIVEFWFSRSLPLNNTGNTEESGVKVDLYIVGDNGYRSEVAEYTGEGCHRITVPPLDKDVSYGIEFTYEDNVYQSAPLKPVSTPPIDSVSLYQSGKNSDVEIRVSTHTSSSESAYFMWDYYEDWEFASPYYVRVLYSIPDSQYYEYHPAPKYYCWEKAQGHDILIGSTEKLKESRIINQQLYKKPSYERCFSILYSTRIRQRGMSKGAYEYYLDLRKSNEEMGGLFTPQPSSIEGNIKCVADPDRKVIGFVDVSYNVTEHLFFIRPGDITRSIRSEPCGEISNDSALNIMNEEKISEHEFIRRGFHPIKETIEGEPRAWVFIRCVDCELNGGTKNKPSFWPNNHE